MCGRDAPRAQDSRSRRAAATGPGWGGLFSSAASGPLHAPLTAVSVVSSTPQLARVPQDVAQHHAAPAGAATAAPRTTQFHRLAQAVARLGAGARSGTGPPARGRAATGHSVRRVAAAVGTAAPAAAGAGSGADRVRQAVGGDPVSQGRSVARPRRRTVRARRPNEPPEHVLASQRSQQPEHAGANSRRYGSPSSRMPVVAGRARASSTSVTPGSVTAGTFRFRTPVRYWRTPRVRQTQPEEARAIRPRRWTGAG